MQKKVFAVLVLFLLAAGADLASAQSRVGPPVGPPKGEGVGPTSLFDVNGEENVPLGPTSLGACTAPSSCSFLGLAEAHWAQNIRYPSPPSLNCRFFNHVWTTLFDYTFTPVEGAQYLGINFTSQATVDNKAYNATEIGIAMECTVFQGSGSIPCPGTTAFPFLTRQNFDSAGHRNGNQGFASYHGMVQLSNDYEPIRVRVRVRTSDHASFGIASGAACYSFIELTQYYFAVGT